jgi:hypothetical protein
VAGDAFDGHVAEWLRSGLQNRLPRFNSGRGLQSKINHLGQISKPTNKAEKLDRGPSRDPRAVMLRPSATHRFAKTEQP